MADNLKTELLREAEALTPAFDESLHNQTMSRLHQARRSQLVVASATSGGSWWKIGKLTAALAAVAIVAAVVFYPSESRLTHASTVELNNALASLRSTGDPFFNHLRLPVDQANTQLTHFKDDAIALGTFFIDRINVLPDQDRSL